MDFKQPVIVYTAATNVEAHLIVDLLHANGVLAHAVEDQSGVSLWSFGTISQYHKPNVWVEQSSAQEAAQLIQTFEQNRRDRENLGQGVGEIQVVCEDCGKTTTFPDSFDGTTQECSHCHAYVDVGDLPWEDDFGTPDES